MLIFGGAHRAYKLQREYSAILESLQGIEVPAFWQWLHYRLDVWFASTTTPKPRILGSLTLLLLLVGTVTHFVVSEETYAEVYPCISHTCTLNTPFRSPY